MKRRRSDSGFTLLEVLLAIILAGSIMTAVMLMAVGLTDIWRGTTPVRNLEVHSRQVVDFLKRGFRRALPVEAEGTAYVFLDYASGSFGQIGAPLLTWEVRESDGLLPWQAQALPYVIYQLEVVDDVGLVLYWQSRLEVEFEETLPRQTLLSAFVSEIEYHYYDPDREDWEIESEPRTNTGRTYDIPNRIRITFEAEEEKEKPLAYMINLPTSRSGLPIF